MSSPPVFLEVQMNTNIKRRFAIIVTVTALVGAAALGLWLFSVHDRAANIDPSPISGGTGEGGEDDGFPGGGLGLLAVRESRHRGLGERPGNRDRLSGGAGERR